MRREKRDDARAWAALAKHGEPDALQRDHDGRLVRVDVLLTPEAEAALSGVVYALQCSSARRLTRAEVARHLLTRAIQQCERHAQRRGKGRHRAADLAGAAGCNPRPPAGRARSRSRRRSGERVQ